MSENIYIEDTIFDNLQIRIEENIKHSEDAFSGRTFKLECSEFLVSQNIAIVRPMPVTIFAGGKLAKILYSTLRKNDIIIAAGTIKRVNSPYGSQRIVLFNFDDEGFDVTLLRFSFLVISLQNVTNNI